MLSVLKHRVGISVLAGIHYRVMLFVGPKFWTVNCRAQVVHERWGVFIQSVLCMIKQNLFLRVEYLLEEWCTPWRQVPDELFLLTEDEDAAIIGRCSGRWCIFSLHGSPSGIEDHKIQVDSWPLVTNGQVSWSKDNGLYFYSSHLEIDISRIFEINVLLCFFSISYSFHALSFCVMFPC